MNIKTMADKNKETGKSLLISVRGGSVRSKMDKAETSTSKQANLRRTAQKPLKEMKDIKDVTAAYKNLLVKSIQMSHQTHNIEDCIKYLNRYYIPNSQIDIDKNPPNNNSLLVDFFIMCISTKNNPMKQLTSLLERIKKIKNFELNTGSHISAFLELFIFNSISSDWKKRLDVITKPELFENLYSKDKHAFFILIILTGICLCLTKKTTVTNTENLQYLYSAFTDNKCDLEDCVCTNKESFGIIDILETKLFKKLAPKIQENNFIKPEKTQHKTIEHEKSRNYLKENMSLNSADNISKKTFLGESSFSNYQKYMLNTKHIKDNGVFCTPLSDNIKTSFSVLSSNNTYVTRSKSNVSKDKENGEERIRIKLLQTIPQFNKDKEETASSEHKPPKHGGEHSNSGNKGKSNLTTNPSHSVQTSGNLNHTPTNNTFTTAINSAAGPTKPSSMLTGTINKFKTSAQQHINIYKKHMNINFINMYKKSNKNDNSSSQSQNKTNDCVKIDPKNLMVDDCIANKLNSTKNEKSSKITLSVNFSCDKTHQTREEIINMRKHNIMAYIEELEGYIKDYEAFTNRIKEQI